MNINKLLAVTMLASIVTTANATRKSESYKFLIEQMGEDSITVQECEKNSGKFGGYLFTNTENACLDLEEYLKSMEEVISNLEEETDQYTTPGNMIAPGMAIMSVLADHPWATVSKELKKFDSKDSPQGKRLKKACEKRYPNN